MKGLETTGGGRAASPTGFNGKGYHSVEFGYYVNVPEGYTLNETEDNMTMGFGTFEREPAMLLTTAIPLDGEFLTPEILDQAADAIPAAGDGVTVTKGRRMIRGDSLVDVVYDMPEQGMRVEFVLYPRKKALIAVMWGTSIASFDRSTAFRDDLFQTRVGFDFP